MDQKIFESFLEAQKQAMELYKWNKGVEKGCDPGQAAIEEWIERYAQKFRKDFILSDLKNALTELRDIRKQIQDYFDKIAYLNKIIDDCESKMISSIELFE
jgi:dGTP triphosphohydrolase